MTSPDTIPAATVTTRILAVIQHRDNMTWFFKMTGNFGLVEQTKTGVCGVPQVVEIYGGGATG